jgi:L-ascorbate metabolism protein UlaG (beta-lactamase superfamily)
MIINFYGQSCIKLQAGDTIIAINPFSVSTKLKTPKFGADIAIATKHDDDHANFAAVSYGEKVAREVYGPGSYEVDDVAINGYGVPGIEGIVTTYIFKFDDMKIVVLGDATDKKAMEVDALEAMSDADVVFVNVDAPEAFSFANSLSPKLIIPTGYESEKEPIIADFLGDVAKDNTEHLEKLTIKLRDIADWKAHVVILKP